MASASARLTDAHRIAQVRLGVRTAARAALMWPLLDMEALDATTTRWLSALDIVVQSEAAASARLAQSYATAYRALELGQVGGLTVAPTAPLNAAAIHTSLTVTGPVKVKTLLSAGRTLAEASEVARAASAAAAQRHALNSGRQVLLDTVRADPEAHGYRRKTSGSPCDYCRDLAAHGAIWGEEHDFHPHDGCGCSLEPVFA